MLLKQICHLLEEKLKLFVNSFPSEDISMPMTSRNQIYLPNLFTKFIYYTDYDWRRTKGKVVLYIKIEHHNSAEIKLFIKNRFYLSSSSKRNHRAVCKARQSGQPAIKHHFWYCFHSLKPCTAVKYNKRSTGNQPLLPQTGLKFVQELYIFPRFKNHTQVSILNEYYRTVEKFKTQIAIVWQHLKDSIIHFY